MKEVLCADCLAEGVTSYRPTHPKATKSRCATHHRAFLSLQKKQRHTKYVLANYGLPEGHYDDLKAYQGGKCAICLRATGATKNLAVDHDHKCCSGPTSCGKCVRGAICSSCNNVLAHARDDVAYFRRAIKYLVSPPYRNMLESRS